MIDLRDSFKIDFLSRPVQFEYFGPENHESIGVLKDEIIFWIAYFIKKRDLIKKTL